MKTVSYYKGFKDMFLHYIVDKNPKQGHKEIQVAPKTHDDRVRLLPDEVDVIVEASTQTPGEHLV